MHYQLPRITRVFPLLVRTLRSFLIMQSVLWVILISLDFFSLQFYPANSLNIFEIFDHNRYDLHLFIAQTITISLSSDLFNFFVSAHVTLLAPICSSRNSYVDVNSFIGQVTDSNSCNINSKHSLHDKKHFVWVSSAWALTLRVSQIG